MKTSQFAVRFIRKWNS